MYDAQRRSVAELLTPILGLNPILYYARRFNKHYVMLAF